MKIDCLMLANASNPFVGGGTELLPPTIGDHERKPVDLQPPNPICVRVNYPEVRVVNEFWPNKSLLCILKRMLVLSDSAADQIQWWNETSLYRSWHLQHCLSNIGASVAWKLELSWFQGDDFFTLLRQLFEGPWTFRAAYSRVAPLDTQGHYSGHAAFLKTVDAGVPTTTEFGARTSYISRAEYEMQRVFARSLDGRSDQAVSADNLELTNEVTSEVHLGAENVLTFEGNPGISKTLVKTLLVMDWRSSSHAGEC